MQEIKVHIDSMSCQGCVSNITKGLNEAGINDLEFSLPEKTVNIKAENLNEKDLLKTLRRINYPASII